MIALILVAVIYLIIGVWFCGFAAGANAPGWSVPAMVPLWPAILLGSAVFIAMATVWAHGEEKGRKL